MRVAAAVADLDGVVLTVVIEASAVSPRAPGSVSPTRSARPPPSRPRGPVSSSLPPPAGQRTSSPLARPAARSAVDGEGRSDQLAVEGGRLVVERARPAAVRVDEVEAGLGVGVLEARVARDLGGAGVGIRLGDADPPALEVLRGLKALLGLVDPARGTGGRLTVGKLAQLLLAGVHVRGAVALVEAAVTGALCLVRSGGRQVRAFGSEAGAAGSLARSWGVAAGPGAAGAVAGAAGGGVGTGSTATGAGAGGTAHRSRRGGRRLDDGSDRIRRGGRRDGRHGDLRDRGRPGVPARRSGRPPHHRRSPS